MERDDPALLLKDWRRPQEIIERADLRDTRQEDQRRFAVIGIPRIGNNVLHQSQDQLEIDTILIILRKSALGRGTIALQVF